MTKSIVVGWVVLVSTVSIVEGAEVRVAAVAGGGVEVRGFVVERPGEVEVEGVELVLGMAGASRAWILDAEERTVVWEMGRGKAVEQSRRTSRYREPLRLGAGGYELYYALREGVGDDHGDAVEGFVRALAGSAVPAEVMAELGVTVRGAVRALGEQEQERLRERQRQELLIDLSGLGDAVREARGFALGAPAEIDVYAVGELRRHGGYDFGWIVDVDDGEAVWEMRWEGSEAAGGGDANRLARARLRLPAGRYAAWFVTDRAHSPESGWHGAPPYDPSSWGMTLRCVDGCETAAAIDYQPVPGWLVAAELTGFGNSERRELTFTVHARDGDGSAAGDRVRLRVYAVGEGIGRMYDHGWIEDAATGERVWSMEYRRTRPAGGSVKNRVADELVELPAGRYRAIYETDGSHSAGGGWNSSPPAEPERWGITLLVPEGGLAPGPGA